MESTKISGIQIIPSTNYAAFGLGSDEKKEGYTADVHCRVMDNEADLNFIWLSFNQYQKWHNWFVERYVKANANILRPKDIETSIEYRTTDFSETFNLTQGHYALILDNTYSQLRSKKVQSEITLRWNTQKPMQSLPIVNSEVIHLPTEVSDMLTKANECYVSGHYEQCSVMIRKGVDFAIRLKLLQSGVKEEELLDRQGNELTLSHKISLLRKKNLITQITSKHLDDVKWYGDLGAHSRVKFTMDDIRNNIEPKVRAFLTGLSLR